MQSLGCCFHSQCLLCLTVDNWCGTLQVQVGMGIPLHRIPDIRRMFGRDPGGTSAIDFEADPPVAPLGVQSTPIIKLQTLTSQLTSI